MAEMIGGMVSYRDTARCAGLQVGGEPPRRVTIAIVAYIEVETVILPFTNEMN